METTAYDHPFLRDGLDPGLVARLRAAGYHAPDDIVRATNRKLEADAGLSEVERRRVRRLYPRPPEIVAAARTLNPIRIEGHVCPTCGTEFLGPPDKKYCSVTCRDREHYARRSGSRTRTDGDRVCQQCHQPYRANSEKARYCSIGCRQAAYYDRSRRRLGLEPAVRS